MSEEREMTTMNCLLPVQVEAQELLDDRTHHEQRCNDQVLDRQPHWGRSQDRNLQGENCVAEARSNLLRQLKLALLRSKEPSTRTQNRWTLPPDQPTGQHRLACRPSTTCQARAA